jgi:hypothetical protein
MYYIGITNCVAVFVVDDPKVLLTERAEPPAIGS